MNRYWEIKVQNDNTGELFLYGDIASIQYFDEITPKQIDAEIKALGDIRTLNVYVNSGGGSVFAGQAIYNIIKRCKATVKNAYIDGLAASIASVIPLACDKVYIPSNAMMMVHNPWAMTSGNASDFRKMADNLDMIRQSIIEVYKEKTGLPEEKLIELMDAETWMTAKQAIEYGFANEIQDEKKIAASIDGDFLNCGNIKIEMSRYKSQEVLKKMYRVEESKPPEPIVDKLKDQSIEFNRIKSKLLGGI
jgi:ATP-dependent Clp protease protease subunit